MNKLSMYCLTLNPNHFKLIKDLNYFPVGLGQEKFSNEWLKDNTGNNITKKNKYYGEYTFHYWIWKNYLNRIDDNWIGFCQYRKFWINKGSLKEVNQLKDLKDIVLNKIPDDLNHYESIIGDPIFVNKFRFSKFIKHNFKKMISSPSLLFDKKKRNLKFHFDLWHGHGNLERAISHLDTKDKIDFTNFMNDNVSFNPHNMFICKSKEILKKYYENIFPWLERCEDEFKTLKLDGYGTQRLYGFLAERYMSYWFQKNTKFKTLPICYKDITDF